MSAGTMSMNEPAVGLPRFVLVALIGGAMAALALVAGGRLQPVLNPSITTLVIEGAMKRLDAAQITAAVNEEATPRLFDVDLAATRARVEALPWVAHARVSRVWPDRIAVRVTERIAVARWGDGALIDTDSHVFTPPAGEIPADLPRLSAPAGHEKETVTTFANLDDSLRESAFKPSGLALDARGEWRLATVIGIELRLGQGDPLARTPLILSAVKDTLSDQLDRVAYVDLRYSNGFSVGWKDGQSPSTVATRAAGGRAAAAKPAAEILPDGIEPAETRPAEMKSPGMKQ